MAQSDHGGSRHGSGDPDEQSRMRKRMKLLQERFPHVQTLSLRLLEQHETFRELCEEYEACTEAAARFEHPGANDALRKEYNALRLRLEGELLRYIAEHDSSGGR